MIVASGETGVSTQVIVRHRTWVGIAATLTAGARAISLALALCLPFASSTRASFERLSSGDGLSSNFVNSIYRDHRGFVWIATIDGLNRWDGYEMAVFRHDPVVPTSPGGSAITDVFEDREGSLWVRLSAGGIDRFDPDTEEFTHFRHFGADSAAGATEYIFASLVDRAGRVYVSSDRGGLFRFDGRRFQPIPSALLEAPASRVTTLEQGDGDTIWVGTEARGLLCFDAAGTQIRAQPLPARSGEGAPAARALGIFSIHRDRRGRVWVGTSNAGLYVRPRNASEFRRVGEEELGSAPIVAIASDSSGQVWCRAGARGLARLDAVSSAVELLTLSDDGSAPLPMAAVNALSVAPSGRVHVSTSSGLWVREPGATSFHRFLHDPRDAHSLSHNVIRSVLEDEDGIAWAATWGGGVNRWNDRLRRFHHTRVRSAAVLDPGAQQINALLESAPGKLWVGTSAGLFEVDSIGRTERALVAGSGPHGGLLSNRITALARAPDGDLWVGTITGLARVRSVDGRLECAGRWLDRPPNGLAINVIVCDPTGDLWLGTPVGLLRLDPRRGELTAQYRAPQLPSDLVTALLPDASGDLWVGTYVGGLSRLSPRDGAVQNYVQQESDPSSIGNRSVTCLFRDSKTRLWIGTYSGGLDRFEARSRIFEHFTKADGLAGNKVGAILEDSTGKLWISTNEGLTRLDPVRREAISFDASDGLQSNEFNVGVAASTTGGELSFGGVNGWNCFHPGEIELRSTPPRIAITAFRLFDRRVPLRGLRDASGTVRLEPRDNFFAFEFTALDFQNPRRNRYAYKLEGFDRDWIECGARRYAGYTNLSPGHYRFRVRGANGDGVWNEAGVSIPLYLEPPWHQTWWFRIGAVASLALLLFAVYRARVEGRVRSSIRLERIRTAERERVRDEVSRDFHDELGHQLTKISLFTELIRRELAARTRAAGEAVDPAPKGAILPESERALAAHVQKVSESSSDLARDARDFIWTLNPEKDSLYELGANLRDFGKALFEDAGVAFEARGLSDELRDVRVPMDRKRQLTLVFKEAMTNVLRHADARSVLLEIATRGDRVELGLIDDGRGIPADPIRSGNGSGNGLANMRRRAKLIEAELEVAPNPDGGTTVRLRAPLGASTPRNGG